MGRPKGYIQSEETRSKISKSNKDEVVRILMKNGTEKEDAGF